MDIGLMRMLKELSSSEDQNNNNMPHWGIIVKEKNTKGRGENQTQTAIYICKVLISVGGTPVAKNVQTQSAIDEHSINIFPSALRSIPTTLEQCCLLLIPPLGCDFSVSLLLRKGLEGFRDTAAARISERVPTCLSLVDEAIVHSHHAALASTLLSNSLARCGLRERIQACELTGTARLVDRWRWEAAVAELRARCVCIPIWL
jgi:hypothetical protein